MTRPPGLFPHDLTRPAPPPLPLAARAEIDRLRALLAQRLPDPRALRDAAAALVQALDAPGKAEADAFAAGGFDRAVLQHLLTMTGPEVARDLIERLGEDLAAVRTALTVPPPSPATAVLRTQAHVLLGLAGSVGATRLAGAAQALNAAIRDDLSPDAPPGAATEAILVEVLEALDAALAFLQDHGPGLHRNLAAQP